MNFKEMKIVTVSEFIFLYTLKSMFRSNKLLHIDTPDCEANTFSGVIERRIRRIDRLTDVPAKWGRD